jgi:hypothetical protein
LFAEHHARMKKETPVRRCCQCRQEFVPDPRVGARQVTCGAARCQVERHAERCRAWRAANADVVASHYRDVVEPFRERQPDYQRRWRLARRVREIREQSRPFGGVMLTSLRALLGRAAALLKSTAREAQTGVLAGKMLDLATTALRAAVAALEQLDTNVASLRTLGL